MTPEEEERRWQELRARWGEEEAHREFLAAFTGVEPLARAGRRYRDALAERPDDAVAARWRDEVVKRATVAGLASLPRTPPREGLPRPVLVAILVLLGAIIAVALWFGAVQLRSIHRAG